MRTRDDRIEHYYNWGAWDLAERIVDLEDAKAKIRAEVLREAAKRIRDHDYDPGEVGPVHLAYQDAADLIDPEVNK